jgi:hypothetical protein
MNQSGERRARSINTHTSIDIRTPAVFGIGCVEDLQAHREQDAEGDRAETPFEGDPPG